VSPKISLAVSPRLKYKCDPPLANKIDTMNVCNHYSIYWHSQHYFLWLTIAAPNSPSKKLNSLQGNSPCLGNTGLILLTKNDVHNLFYIILLHIQHQILHSYWSILQIRRSSKLITIIVYQVETQWMVIIYTYIFFKTRKTTPSRFAQAWVHGFLLPIPVTKGGGISQTGKLVYSAGNFNF